MSKEKIELSALFVYYQFPCYSPVQTKYFNVLNARILCEKIRCFYVMEPFLVPILACRRQCATTV